MDGTQPARLQHGLDAPEAPCNADHQGMKNYFHVHLDPINPIFDVVTSGRPTILSSYCTRTKAGRRAVSRRLHAGSITIVTQEKFTHRSVFTPQSSRGSVKRREGPQSTSLFHKKFVLVPKLQVSLVEKLATNVDLYQ